MDKAADKAEEKAIALSRHPAFNTIARIGFIVTGVLNIIIGWLAIQIGLDAGASSREVSNSGALAAIATRPGGQIALWGAAIALVALGIWHLVAIFATDSAKDKAKDVLRGVVYIALALTAGRFAAGGSSSDSAKSESITGTILAQPGGALIIVLAGLIILGVGGYQMFKGATKRFKKDLKAGTSSGQVGSGIVAAGMVGHLARGFAFGVLGVLVIAAAITSDPDKAGGLDQALRTLSQQPFGQVLLVVVGAGFILYGLYSIARSRYQQPKS